MGVKLARLIAFVALLAAIGLFSPAAAHGNGATQTMGVHDVNACVDSSA